MRKQARRLWFGDWQQGADQADTVVILPDEGADEQVQSEKSRPLINRGIVAGVSIAAVVALMLAISSANNDNTLTSRQSPIPPAQTQVPNNHLPQVPQGAPPQGFGGADLAGTEAQRAAEAAVAKFPGDVERVTAGPTGGGYVVHVIQPDGNEVHVLVDPDFKVQGSDANSGAPNFGSGTSQ